MKIKAFKIQQFGKGEEAKPINIYSTVIAAEKLIEKTTIDRWSRDNRDGYQRPPDDKRITSTSRLGILGYLLKQGGVFPTSVLVSSRSGDLKFKSKAKIFESIEFGDLSIPDDETLYIIDGQHRGGALEEAIRRDPAFNKYPLIVSILELDRPFDEMLYFHIVNSRQKKIRTDLAIKHMQKMIEKIPNVPKWITKVLGPRDIRRGTAATITELLGEDEDSPFCGKIQFMGEDRMPEHVTTDLVMETYIAKYVLKETTFGLMSTGNVAKRLKAYWNAIMDLYPEPFKEPDKYTLTKTSGIAAFHRIFPTVHAYAGQDITRKGFKAILTLLKQKTPKHPDPTFRNAWTSKEWSLDHGPTITRATSEKMFKELADGLAKKITIGLEGRKK